MTAIVGRTGEVAQIERAVLDARDGRGQLLLLSGPAGIGKSALAAVALDCARRHGLLIATGYAIDDPGAPPLWPWTRAMQGWADARDLPIAQVGESDAAARFRLYVAIAELLRERAVPAGLVVVLEDMHWADQISVSLVRHLLAELAHQPIAIVLTTRDATSTPLAQVWPDLIRGDTAVPIPLAGLTTADVHDWLPALIGESADRETLADALRQRTAGNPLLIRLVAEDLGRTGGRAGIESLDRIMTFRPQLRRLVAAKVDALDADARDVIEAAAVLGERLAPDLLAAVTGEPEPDVRRLLEHALTVGILQTDGDDRMQFEHALIRDAVYADLTPTRRVTLHRQAALALERGRGEPAAGSIARHWARTSGVDALRNCALWSERADEAARVVLAFEAAAEFAQLAVTCSRPGGADNAEHARLLIRLAEAQSLANRMVDSVKTCVAAADVAEAAGRGDLLAGAALVVHGMGDPYANRTIPMLCERALALLAPDAHVLRARLQSQLAIGAAEADGGPRCAELAAAALDEAERSGDAGAILEAVAARHLAISIPQTVQERLELGRRAVELGGATRQPIAALWGHLWRLDAAFQLGNMAAVDRGLAAVDRVARERASPLARWHHLRYSAERAALVGDFVLARTANDSARELAVRVGEFSMLGMDYAFRLELASLRGSVEELSPGWEEVIKVAPPMPLVRISIPLGHAIAGDIDTARAEFEEFRHLPTSFPVGVRWAATVGQIAKTAVLLDDAEVCAQAYELFAPFADHYTGDGSGGVFNDGSYARILGDYAYVLGRYSDAIAHHRNGIAMNARIGARPFTALGRLGLARSLIALGYERDPDGRESVEDLLVQATAEFGRLDMPGPLAMAVGLAARADRAPSPLTVRQQEIAELVAVGMANKAIAQRLFLSERTVESHVRSILANLALTSRTEIAAWMHRR